METPLRTDGLLRRGRHAACVPEAVPSEPPSLSTVLDVLRAAGFRVLDEGPDHVSFRRGARWLQVPKSEEALRTRWKAVLASAGMDESTFHTLAGAARAMLNELPSSRNLRAAADVAPQSNGRSRR